MAVWRGLHGFTDEQDGDEETRELCDLSWCEGLLLSIAWLLDDNDDEDDDDDDDDDNDDDDDGFNRLC